MPSQSVPWRVAGAALCVAAFVTTSARASDDPFATLAAVPPLTGLGPVEGAAPCQPPKLAAPLGLAEVVDAALCHNPQTRQVWATARAQAALVGVAQSAFLPGVSASASATRSHSDATRTSGGGSTTSRSLGLDLAYVLYDFGARSASLENARQLFAASAATRDATVQSVFLAAVQAYFQVQSAAAALEASRLSEAAALEALNAAEARYRAGVATPADRLQARTAHSQAVLNRITAEGAQQTAQGTLANVIGQDPTRPLALVPLPPAAPGAGFAADVAQLIEEARRRRPDLAAAEAQFRAAQANIEAARAAGLPTLTLGVGASRSAVSGSPTTDSSSIGVTLSIPIFTGYATTYRVRAAEAQAEAQAASRDQVRLRVALDVWNAYAGLTTATQSVKSAEDLLESALQSERVAAGRYKAGVGTILDLLTAQSALASARQQRIQAGFGWFSARAALAQSMGVLDAAVLGELTLSFPAPSPPRNNGDPGARP